MAVGASAPPQHRFADRDGWLKEQDGERILRRDDGGRWCLAMGPIVRWRSRKLLGKRVWIVGVRDGFDALVVKKIAAV
ncbi:MAG TPA: DUF5818 domain-containing protein [Sphingomicrobium sp.]